MMWLMIVIYGVVWLGSVTLAAMVWTEQREYVARHAKTVHWDERYDPAVQRAAARMIIFGWAWPLLVLRAVYRMISEFIGKVALDATSPQDH